MDAVYDRIAAVIKRGIGSRLIAVLVPSSTPLRRAIRELRLYMSARGIETRSVDVEGFANLSELAVASTGDEPQAIIVHGLEALSTVDRESFLRSSSFERTRLRELSVPIMLLLGTETWSWLGMELPDFARWADGPFSIRLPRSRPNQSGWMKDMIPTSLPARRPRRPHPPARAPKRRPALSPSAKKVGDDHSILLFEQIRNVEIRSTFLKWLDRGSVLLLGGPPGVGLSKLSTGLEQYLESLERPVASMSSIWLDQSLRASATPTTQDIDTWLEERRTDVIVADRAFFPDVVLALVRKNMSGIVRGPSRSVLGRAPAGTIPLYVPPIQVVDLSGRPHPPGIETMLHTTRVDVERQMDVDLNTFLPNPLLSNLAFASGGIPGLLWQMIFETEQRATRLGTSDVSLELVHSVVQDVARAKIQAIDEGDIERAVRENALAFSLESKSAVLFYVIDGELRTLRHPLLTLCAEGASLPFT